MDIIIGILIVCGFAALVFFSEMRSKKNAAIWQAEVQGLKNQIAALSQKLQDKLAGK